MGASVYGKLGGSRLFKNINLQDLSERSISNWDPKTVNTPVHSIPWVFNTVETYVLFGMRHMNPNKGQFDFSGLDWSRAAKQLQSLDLTCRLCKSSPFICAEWEFMDTARLRRRPANCSSYFQPDEWSLQNACLACWYPTRWIRELTSNADAGGKYGSGG